MRLGAFWGLTAPMLILLKDSFDNGVYEQYAALLNVSGNTGFLMDFLKELKYLLDYIDNFPCEYRAVCEDDFKILQDCHIANNVINNDSEDALYLAYDKLAAEVGIKILNDVSKGKNNYDKHLLGIDNNSVVSTVNAVIKDYLSSVDLDLNNTKSAVIKIAKQFYNASVSLDDNDCVVLKQSLQLERKIPDVVQVNGIRTTLSGVDKKYLKLLLDSRSFILQCIEAVKITKQKDIPLFDTTFQSYIHCRPTSLYYKVQTRFDYVKATNVSFLRTILAETRNDMQKLHKCIDDFVIVGYENQNILTDELFQERLCTFEDDKRNFFSELYTEEYFHVDDMLCEDLDVLSSMYDIIDNLNLPHISKILGETLTAEQFQTLTDSMCAIGIYGLNLWSLELFKDFIKSVMLITSNKVQKTEEQMTELMLVVNNVQALLDSFIPIGGAINV